MSNAVSNLTAHLDKRAHRVRTKVSLEIETPDPRSVVLLRKAADQGSTPSVLVLELTLDIGDRPGVAAGPSRTMRFEEEPTPGYTSVTVLFRGESHNTDVTVIE